MNEPLHDADWHERMYNNLALVAHSAQHLQGWTERSARVRQEQVVVLDVAYGPAASESLDIFPAQVAQGDVAPVLVFIHGGYWRALDKADHSFVAPAFAQAGCCVVVVNYALCPGTAAMPVSIGSIFAQMQRALAWVQDHVAGYGGDPARVTVAGHSAGGHLAAMLLAAGQGLRNALSVSGLHDLDPLMHTPRYQSVLALTPERVRAWSPVHQPAPRQGVLWCAAGADESPEFLRQNQLMRGAWGDGAVPRTEALAGLNHLSIVDALAQPGTVMHGMARALLNA